MKRLLIKDVMHGVLYEGKKSFVPYIMAGDGGLEQLIPRLELLQNAGATMVEIGVPFSDPVADGPVIQAAGLRALQAGTTLRAILDTLENVREKITIPLIFMTYLNPILSIGIESFAMKCKEIGIDACIIPDVPLEEEDEMKPILNNYGIAFIRLASLTSPPERLQQICEGAEGFLYAVTVKGVTGVRNEFEKNVESYLQNLKEMSQIPVLAGFGISTPEHVRNMIHVCDGVIVGSRIIQLLERGAEEEITHLIKALYE